MSLNDYGPSFKRATGDRVIDAEGMYVLPGFIETHAHVPEGRVVPAGERWRQYAYYLWLAHGVTTIRELGARAGVEALLKDKRRSAANEFVRGAEAPVTRKYLPSLVDW